MNAIHDDIMRMTCEMEETEEEFILKTIMPYAQAIEKRINKEELKKAIIMYYREKDSAEVEE